MSLPTRIRKSHIETDLLQVLDTIDAAVYKMRELNTDADYKNITELLKCKKAVKKMLNQRYDTLARNK